MKLPSPFYTEWILGLHINKVRLPKSMRERMCVRKVGRQHTLQPRKFNPTHHHQARLINGSPKVSPSPSLPSPSAGVGGPVSAVLPPHQMSQSPTIPLPPHCYHHFPFSCHYMSQSPTIPLPPHTPIPLPPRHHFHYQSYPVTTCNFPVFSATIPGLLLQPIVIPCPPFQYTLQGFHTLQSLQVCFNIWCTEKSLEIK